MNDVDREWLAIGDPKRERLDRISRQLLEHLEAETADTGFWLNALLHSAARIVHRYEEDQQYAVQTFVDAMNFYGPRH